MTRRKMNKRDILTTTISEEDKQFCIQKDIPYRKVIEVGVERLREKLSDDKGNKTEIDFAKFEKILAHAENLNEKYIKLEEKYLDLWEKYKEKTGKNEILGVKNEQRQP